MEGGYGAVGLCLALCRFGLRHRAAIGDAALRLAVWLCGWICGAIVCAVALSLAMWCCGPGDLPEPALNEFSLFEFGGGVMYSVLN